jgi:hypothetical protein
VPVSTLRSAVVTVARAASYRKVATNRIQRIPATQTFALGRIAMLQDVPMSAFRQATRHILGNSLYDRVRRHFTASRKSAPFEAEQSNVGRAT